MSHLHTHTHSHYMFAVWSFKSSLFFHLCQNTQLCKTVKKKKWQAIVAFFFFIYKYTLRFEALCCWVVSCAIFFICPATMPARTTEMLAKVVTQGYGDERGWRWWVVLSSHSSGFQRVVWRGRFPWDPAQVWALPSIPKEELNNL